MERRYKIKMTDINFCFFFCKKSFQWHHRKSNSVALYLYTKIQKTWPQSRLVEDYIVYFLEYIASHASIHNESISFQGLKCNFNKSSSIKYEETCHRRLSLKFQNNSHTMLLLDFLQNSVSDLIALNLIFIKTIKTFFFSNAAKICFTY